MIVAVNQAFDLPDAKAIIDLFLVGARESVFTHIERRDATFKSRYEQGLAEYFRAVAERSPGIAVSFCFIRNLGLDPLKRVDAQVSVAKRFGETLSSTIAMLKTMQIVRAPK